ncbi:hypothetical protein ES703_27190 [subsurface metagenome]
MTKKLLFGLITITLVALVAVPLSSSCVPAPAPVKDSIVIGASRPLSGMNAMIGDAAFGPIMAMWEEEVNAAGGIYVEEYGKKLPIEYLIYDDATDVGTMVRLTEKLILEDKVDILFSSCGTAFISAQAPIANKYGYVLLTAEGGATIMRDFLSGLPHVFVSLPFSDHYQLPVFADMLAAKGAKTAYIVTIADLHGVEYGGVAAIEFARVGIDVIASVSVPETQEDFSIIIKDAKAADPDVFCVFAYPPQVLPCTAESMALGFNPKCFIAGPGANFGFYQFTYIEALGPNCVDGVLCFAAANRATSPAFTELYDDLEAIVGPAMLDWWGHPYYASLVQIWQEAIEETGTLDQDVLRDYIATHHFDTILGDTYFEMFGEGGGGLMVKETHPGEIGQWQNGVVEIVGGGPWPNTVTTADFIYPKPPWPTP